VKKIYRRSILLVAVSAIFSSIFVPSASAVEKGYRYWGYFQAAPGAKAWTMAMTGPTVPIADGSVEGWAFTFSSDSIPDAATPHMAPNFTRICGLVKTVPTGKKRIGLIVDFGSAFLRPTGEHMPRNFTKCVVVDKNAVGVDVLAQVVKVRTQSSGFICAFSSYPAKECGAEVTTPAALIPKK
jgi:hypothetical protein